MSVDRADNSTDKKPAATAAAVVSSKRLHEKTEWSLVAIAKSRARASLVLKDHVLGSCFQSQHCHCKTTAEKNFCLRNSVFGMAQLLCCNNYYGQEALQIQRDRATNTKCRT